ncbi:MAG: hypothetical protein ACRC4X_05390 [Cetobacterium sp.]
MQVLAEGSWGARRPLELQSVTQKIKINRVYQNARLPYWPIADLPAPIVKVRHGQPANRWGRFHGVTPWYFLDDPQYWIEENGKIHLHISHNFSWGHEVGSSNVTELEVTYTAGFDFTQDTPDVRLIKAVVGNLAGFLSDAEGLTNPVDPNDITIPGTGSALTPFGSSIGPVEEWDIDDTLKIRYGEKTSAKSLYGGSNPGKSYQSVIEAMLMPLRKYYPRSLG